MKFFVLAQTKKAFCVFFNDDLNLFANAGDKQIKFALFAFL